MLRIDATSNSLIHHGGSTTRTAPEPAVRAGTDRPIRVVLIQPSEPFGAMAEIPISIIGLASILQQAGIDVEILDARLDNLSVCQTIRRLQDKPVDVVGITGLNNAYRYIKDFCFEFKRRFPHIPIMAGGVFILSQPERIMPRVPIDVACTGEGEEIIVELVRRLAMREPLGELPNLAYWDNGRLVQTPRALVEDFDRFPLPAYDLLQMDRYLQAAHYKTHLEHYHRFYFPLITGRGCVHHCYFCGRSSKKVRRLSPEKTLEQMDYLHQRYGLDSFLFADNSAIYPREWIIRFCQLLIENDRHYNLLMAGCPEQVDEELVQYLARAGCRQFNIGVEHWNPEIIKGFFRTTQSKHIIRAWQLFEKYGISVLGFNILWGHPKDTARSIRQAYRKSIEMARRYRKPNFWFATLVVYPNSKLQQDALQSGRIRDYEDYMYASGGYAPYVNLTQEDDDVFRGVMVEQKLISEIQFSIDKLHCLLFSDVEVDASSWDKIAEQLRNHIHTLAVLRKLLSLPMAQREPFRRQLEAILRVPLFDPEKNYYHEIGCFKEILELPPRSTLAVYGPDSFVEQALIRLFNSAREAKLKIAGFVDVNAHAETYEQCLLVRLDNLEALRADTFVICEERPEAEMVVNFVRKYFPALHIVQISKASTAPRPWYLGDLNSSYYNPDFWEVALEGSTLVRRRRPEAQDQPQSQLSLSPELVAVSG